MTNNSFLAKVPGWKPGYCFDCKSYFFPDYSYQYFCNPCRETPARLTVPKDLVHSEFYRNIVKRTQKG